jgi:hypothetical protein
VSSWAVALFFLAAAAVSFILRRWLHSLTDDYPYSVVPHSFDKLTRPCTVAGCNGTMYFHDRREAADAPHTLEWPWYATWVCAENPTHVQLLTDAEVSSAKETATNGR